MMVWIINIGFFLLIIAAWAAYELFFHRTLNKISGEVVDSATWLRNLSEEESNDRFHDIDDELNKYPSITNDWQDFSKSLSRYTDGETGEQSVYSVAEAAYYFSFARFTENLNIGFWQAYGGTFTGLGILGTFVGLTLGLAGIDMGSSDIEVLKEGISGLLSGVQSAFVTSLMGIGVALVYNFYHHRHISLFKTNVQSFTTEIERLFPRRTAEQWLAQQYAEAQDQTKTLKNLSEDMARDLGDLLDDRLNNGFQELCETLTGQLTPIFDKLSDAITELNSSGTATLGQVMSERAGKQMDSFAASLQDLQRTMQDSLAASQRANQEMNEHMLNTVNQLGNTLLKGADDAAAKQREAMTETQKQIASLTKYIGQESVNALKNMKELSSSVQQDTASSLERLDGVIQSCQDMIDNHNAAMKKIYDEVKFFAEETQNTLQHISTVSATLNDVAKPIQEATAGLKTQLDIMHRETSVLHSQIGQQIAELTKANGETTTNIARLLTGVKEQGNAIAQAWANYQRNFDRVGGELEKATDIITDRLQKYNEMMSEGMKGSLSAFDKSVSQATNALTKIADELGETAETLAKGNR
ncbi:MAG: anti-phage defense ZorAB system ZorA [Selenomonadaceae bacterium]|nr:anti-phage defense ZorAB system ZorA [Selenomonadaceae bacterium]